ncbi:MAG: hypothetical protein JWP38_3758 [Herbaspirillum sp.]|nr:hypothetical protein [Herbaspirillum sp.]
MPVTEVHEEKNTFQVDVNIPGHDPRVSTPLFHRSRLALIAREGGRCWISGMTAEEAGHPLEAHHHPIERSFATMIDWARFSKDCLAGMWGAHAQAFDWTSFDPADPYMFVDDMTVNGVLLAKQFHIGKDEGTHCLPYPVWVAQKYGIEGYKFSDVEIIHHSDKAAA